SYIVGHTSVNQHGNLTGVFVCQKWKGEPGGVIAECHVNCLIESDAQAYANAEFIAEANPATVLALLDERERNQQYIKRRDQENEDIALTVGKLRVELEGKDSKIANLTAERDALREGEMGDARHSNTRAAADIYFQLVEECEIPAGGSLVEYVDDMREKLEAAEKRIAELESGSQAQKLVEAIIVAIENEQERLFDEDYLMDSKECIDVIREEVKRWNDSRAAGIRIKGE
ncbi:TPA: ead/Ea22-like family protein, partial [Escherichia coli]|nr:ead/Ea22-like family protein [Escherichia coli]